MRERGGHEATGKVGVKPLPVRRVACSTQDPHRKPLLPPLDLVYRIHLMRSDKGVEMARSPWFPGPPTRCLALRTPAYVLDGSPQRSS